MSVRVEGQVIFLEDQCHVEAAEQLLLRLQEDPSRTVNMSRCRHLHSAVAQVLLSCAAQVGGEPPDAFLAGLVALNFQHRKGPQ